jgi:hypothetical protein
MDETMIYLAAFITLAAVAVATAIVAVRNDGRNAGNLIKQVAIWVSIAALLPLTSFAGATILHPKTKMTDLRAQQQRVQQESYESQDVQGRERRANQLETLRKQIEEETRAFNQAMFWVAFPVGFAALVVGFFLKIVPVGAGLIFGGLCTLTAGCYSYWNDMGDAVRLCSLLVVLATVVTIGLVKFGRPVSSEAL